MPLRANRTAGDLAKASDSSKNDYLVWSLFFLLLGCTLYRQCVARPIWVEAYLLYLPGAAFVIPLILLLAYSRPTKGSLCRSLGALLLVFGWLFPFGLARTVNRSYDCRLVSLNIQSQSTNLQRAIAKIRALKPDFVCIQEIWHQAKLAEAEQFLPDYLVFGAASREKERARFNAGTFLAIRKDWKVKEVSLTEESAIAEISRDGVALAVVSVHAPRAKGFAPASLLQTVTEQTKNGIELRDELAGVQAPIIIAGDFNAPESGPAFKILGERFHSAFEQAGTGFGLTFPSGFPLTRIDHALGTREIVFAGYRTEDFGSDHLGLIVDFEISQ